MRRLGLLIFGSILLLWAVTAQLNHALSGLGVHLFAGGLFVTFVALQFPTRGALLLSAAVGLLCDAATPVPLGIHLFLFAGAHALIAKFRQRLPADHDTTQLIVALAANAALYLALTVILATRQPLIAALWPRLLWDLILSETYVALVGPWFFALQGRILDLDRFALRGRL